MTASRLLQRSTFFIHSFWQFLGYNNDQLPVSTISLDFKSGHVCFDWPGLGPELTLAKTLEHLPWRGLSTDWHLSRANIPRVITRVITPLRGVIFPQTETTVRLTFHGSPRLSANVKLEFWHCTPPWFLHSERVRRALQQQSLCRCCFSIGLCRREVSTPANRCKPCSGPQRRKHQHFRPESLRTQFLRGLPNNNLCVFFSALMYSEPS